MSLIPTTEEAKQVLYDSVLTSAGAIAVAYAAYKMFGEKLEIPMTTNGMIMFTIAVFLGNMIVSLMQKKKWIKEDL